MKNILFFAFVFLASCADSRYEPILWQELKGEWVRAENPNRHYIFAQDYVTTWDYNFSTVVAPKWYAAEWSGERGVNLKEINTDIEKFWQFSEITGDTLVTVAENSEGVPVFYFNLKRVK